MPIVWRKQAAAWVGDLSLSDGRRGNIVLVGPRANPRGAVLVLPEDKEGKVTTTPISAGYEMLDPQQLIEIQCMQERAFGKTGLTPPQE